MVKTDPNFMPVCAKPFHYSPDYTVSSQADNRLSPDTRLIANKMNLQYSPLPIAHEHKKRHIVIFMTAIQTQVIQLERHLLYS